MPQILRFVAAFAGLLTLYVGWALYPGEKREMRNRLEDWWYRLSLAGEVATTAHARFLRLVVAVVEQPLEVIVASPLSAFWNTIFVTTAAIHLLHLMSVGRWWDPITIILSLLIAFLPALPAISGYARFALRCIGIAWLQPLALVEFIGFSGDWHVWITDALVLLFGCAAYYGVILLTLQLIRLSTRPRSWSLVVKVVCTVGAAAAILLSPFLWLGTFIDYLVTFESGPGHRILSHFITVLWFHQPAFMIMSVLACWPVALFLLVLVILLIHRIFWVACERMVYAVWEYGVISNRPLLTTLGILLLAASGWAWAIRVREFITKLK